tara:strand:+ start:61 stop:876 length:816 start_codon:yes stop_codon:yes gene_type:complete
MAHDHHAEVGGKVGETLWIPLPDDTAALLIGSYTVEVSANGVADLVPVTTLGLALTEVDNVNQVGMYYLSLVPVQAGSLFLKLTRGGFDYEFTVTVAEADFSDAGLEGDYVVTIDDGTDAVQGAQVTLYDAAGTALVQRATTDALGEVTFYSLPVGNYQVRAFKAGVDFTSINPSTITVVASDTAAPVIDEILPATFSIGGYIVILGRLFDPADTMVVFGAEATVAPSSVNAAGTAILVLVPGGLTNTIIAMQVSKAANTIFSNVVTAVRT